MWCKCGGEKKENDNEDISFRGDEKKEKERGIIFG